MYTTQDLYNTAYGIIAQGQDSTAYPTSLMLSFLNKAQNDICYGNVVNLQSGERLEKQALSFLEANTFYSSYPFTTLPSSAVAGNTTMMCTNTFPSSGTLWINGNIVTYANNDGEMIYNIPATGTGSLGF
jgi:hypothetical protein